jgi:hypothetical protein
VFLARLQFSTTNQTPKSSSLNVAALLTPLYLRKKRKSAEMVRALLVKSGRKDANS